MRYLSNAVAGAAGMVVLLGAMAATPAGAYGQNKANGAADVAVADLGACGNLEVPAGNEITFHVYATGVQIYRWNGASWVFLAPEATLYADAGFHGQVGTHYAGPTWESNSGSRVVGRVLERCTPDPTAIQWLKLEAVYTQGPGVFDGVTFVQRVNTVGGLAPSSAGAVVGEIARVPYTTEYYFYRPQE
jgi:hypothetical protein